MKIKTERLKLLNSVFSSCAYDLDIIPNEDGWNVQAGSADHVCMMSVHIASTAFEDYEVYPRFALSIKNLTEGLKNMKAVTELKLTDGNARMVFSSEGLRMKIPLPMPHDENVRTPDLKFNSGFVCNLDSIRKVLDVAKSPIIRFNLDQDSLSVSSLDETGCGPSVDIPVDKLLSAEGVAKAGYGVGYLKDFVAKFPKDGVGSFEYDTDKPMSISFAIDEVEGKYLIAPMIEEEI